MEAKERVGRKVGGKDASGGIFLIVKSIIF